MIVRGTWDWNLIKIETDSGLYGIGEDGGNSFRQGREPSLAIGKPGAINAALLAAAVLAISDEALALRLQEWRQRQTDAVIERPI